MIRILKREYKRELEMRWREEFISILILKKKT
jgi:hypothetical protein